MQHNYGQQICCYIINLLMIKNHIWQCSLISWGISIVNHYAMVCHQLTVVDNDWWTTWGIKKQFFQNAPMGDNPKNDVIWLALKCLYCDVTADKNKFTRIFFGVVVVHIVEKLASGSSERSHQAWDLPARQCTVCLSIAKHKLPFVIDEYS